MAYSNPTTATEHTDPHTNTGKAKKTQTDKMRDAVSSAQDSVHDAAENVRSSASTAVEKSTERAHDVQSEFDSAVRRNPTLAVLGALGLGVALGLALNKRA